mmetsp:Transcript_38676/g.121871  ORF Transcript_38676/g.121871 Transcript_38676/m.121871 type:complete len:288 (-) Transcript_38676:6-869(-)
MAPLMSRPSRSSRPATWCGRASRPLRPRPSPISASSAPSLATARTTRSMYVRAGGWRFLWRRRTLCWREGSSRSSGPGPTCCGSRSPRTAPTPRRRRCGLRWPRGRAGCRSWLRTRTRCVPMARTRRCPASSRRATRRWARRTSGPSASRIRSSTRRAAPSSPSPASTRLARASPPSATRCTTMCSARGRTASIRSSSAAECTTESSRCLRPPPCRPRPTSLPRCWRPLLRSTAVARPLTRWQGFASRRNLSARVRGPGGALSLRRVHTSPLRVRVLFTSDPKSQYV